MEAHASPLWSRLPAELHLAVIDLLAVSPASLAALSQTSKSIHALALPALLHRVTLPSFPALLAFLDRLPPPHGTHIRELTLCTAAPAAAPNEWHLPATPTPRTDALVRLLALTPHLHTLDLRLSGGLAPHAIPAVARLPALRTLALANADDEADCPLSERLVTALALALPGLTSLTLARITRSLSAAPDLACARIPLVANDAPPSDDDERPTSPVLASPDPTLPALLTHPTLTHLALHATHLGAPAWALPSLRPTAPLASLALGAHPALPPAQAAAHAGTVLRAAERARLRVLELDVGLAGPAVEMPCLEKVTLGPLHPPSAIGATMGVCGAVPKLEVRAVAEDVIDVCEELGAFLEDMEEEVGVREVRVVCVPGVEEAEAGETDAEAQDAVDALRAVCAARGVRFALD